MKVTALPANQNKVDDLEITISMTMTMYQWRLIRDKIKETPYNWSKEEFTTNLSNVIDNYSDKFTAVFEKK